MQIKKIGFKHGMSGTLIYGIWATMRQRCLNKNCIKYRNYGGRGIVICSKWLGKNGFQNFYKDMGERPEGKTLDRRNNNGNYCKNNCRWATQKEQMNNMRKNRVIIYNKKSQTLSQWSKELGIKSQTILMRLDRNWNIEEALTAPLKINQFS